jgi:hypothetical protein
MERQFRVRFGLLVMALLVVLSTGFIACATGSQGNSDDDMGPGDDLVTSGI